MGGEGCVGKSDEGGAGYEWLVRVVQGVVG